MAPLLCCLKIRASFHSHRWIQPKVTVRKRSIRVKIGDFLSCVTLKFDGWSWKTIGLLFYGTSSFAHHLIPIGEFKLYYWVTVRKCPIWVKVDDCFSRVTLKFDGWPWKNDRARLLSNVKLDASFHHHMWIQRGITTQKRLSRVLNFVALTFDLWPWSFVWASFLSLVITP